VEDKELEGRTWWGGHQEAGLGKAAGAFESRGNSG